MTEPHPSPTPPSADGWDFPKYFRAYLDYAPKQPGKLLELDSGKNKALKNFAYQLCCGLTEGLIDGAFVRRAFAEVYAACALADSRHELHPVRAARLASDSSRETDVLRRTTGPLKGAP
jgi:hypothetical protein